MPRAPRYWLVVSPVPARVAWRVATSPPAPPPTRAVASPAVPLIRARVCSTGPPGAAWMMTKFTSMIPNSVGTISSSRRTM